MNYKKSFEINEKLHALVPGGSHTYSKGEDQFPYNSPRIMSHAKGAYTWDVDGNKFIDWAMGNRVFILGHAFDEVDNAVIDTIKRGTNYTRPGILEYETADYLINEHFDKFDMIKFGKNGSDVTTAAIKLARAYTGRKYVLVCGTHPFFSIHDWFIGSTDMNSGTLDTERQYTIKFFYNDRESVEKAFDQYKDQIAAIILEPVKNDSPYLDAQESDLHLETLIQKNNSSENNFLKYLREKADKEGSVLIFDEMISGMRFDTKGAHSLYGVYPDLSTFGKSIANGYSCSFLVGKKEIMELGGLKHKKERVFLLSQTHGSETTGFAATLATFKASKKYNVSNHVWNLGRKLKSDFNTLVNNEKVADYFKIIGFDANPQILCTKRTGEFWPELHTFFHDIVINEGVFIPWITITLSHTDEHLHITMDAIRKAIKTLKPIIENNEVEKLLVGDPVKPVFRKYN
ncbi:glutamate-1-semialdehyde 2,1-aminomutase [Sulfurimonas sp. HSL3-2]|uniref:glutamate-1-semialdehyde 2,1-aminomutase n=1 Tax=Hydrocurvibacter mobilis TaxID=3131936 RepID=UPI0031F9E749